MGKKHKLFPTLGALAIGAGLGILFAPKKGSETRQDLLLKFNELKDAAKKLDKDDVYNYIENKVNVIKRELEDLDKEKVLAVAKGKSKILQAKADDLVKYAKEKGNEELNKVSLALKEKTIEVSKEIVRKLEEK